MAYSCAATGTEYLRTTPESLFSYPFTINCWFRLTTVSAQRNLVMLENSGNAQRLALFVNANNNLVLVAVDNGTTQTTITGVTIAANTWYMATGVFTSATSRTVYLNGANAVTGTVSRTPTTPARVLIGAQYAGGATTSNLNGRIAEVAIWDVALGTSDIASLYNYAKPTAVQPGKLQIYYPLVREVYNICGRDTVNTDGGTKGADHQRRYG